VGRYNSELANGLGNLVSRTLTMIHQYRGGAIPAGGDAEISAAAAEAIRAALAHYEEFEFSRALEAVWGLLSAVDRFIVRQAPWKLARSQDPEAPAQLDSTLYTAAEALRVAAVLLAPVIPESCAKIWSMLGFGEPLDAERFTTLAWGGLPAGQKIGAAEALFPRLEPKEIIARITALEAEVAAAQAQMLGRALPPAAPASEKIGIEDFSKVDLRVGLVLSAERVKGSDKLLHLKVDLAESQPRTILAGIAEAYTPEQMVGRKVVIVANLQPRKLRGIESNGMIVAASLEGEKPVLAGFLEDVPAGARLK
jgi:methionyl-tRNA synthetase